MYGYGTDQDEVAEMEAREFHERWQAEKSRVIRTVPNGLGLELRTIFKRTPHNNPIQHEFVFVNAIAWRVYTEACMNPEERRNGFNPDTYKGEALLKFIDDETLFASRRAHEKGLELTSGQIRTKVLEGLVKRAAELFGEWSSYDEPQPPSRKEEDEHGVPKYIYEDKRNLRDSLEPYIRF
jgi:hypothetical protein